MNAAQTGVAPTNACVHRPHWRVGDVERACDECLPAVLRHVRATSDGFTPVLVLPLGAKR